MTPGTTGISYAGRIDLPGVRAKLLKSNAAPTAIIENRTIAELATPRGPWIGLRKMPASAKVSSSGGITNAERLTPATLQPATNPHIKI